MARITTRGRLIVWGGCVALGACAAMPASRDTAPNPRPTALTSAPARLPPATPLPPADARLPAPPQRIDRVADPLTRLLGSATAMIGQPYRFGGAAPGGFDCSGLVVYAGAGAGIPLPRTAREQLLAGTPVKRGDVRAGDLVFLRLRHHALHVGIALDARQFIHAPSRGGHVRVDALDRKPYAAGFVVARRILG